MSTYMFECHRSIFDQSEVFHIVSHDLVKINISALLCMRGEISQ